MAHPPPVSPVTQNPGNTAAGPCNGQSNLSRCVNFDVSVTRLMSQRAKFKNSNSLQAANGFVSRNHMLSEAGLHNCLLTHSLLVNSAAFCKNFNGNSEKK